MIVTILILEKLKLRKLKQMNRQKTGETLYLAGKLLQVVGNDFQNKDFRYKVYCLMGNDIDADDTEIDFYVDDYLTNVMNYVELTNEQLEYVLKELEVVRKDTK